MTELLTFCLCCSLAELAIYISVNHQGMVLNWVRQPLDELFGFYKNAVSIKNGGGKVGQYFSKPLYKCLVCMSSFWTIVIYLSWFGKIDMPKMLFSILICCGINKLICAFLEKSTDYGC